MFRNTEVNTLGFLTASGAFYAQQTDQANLFMGLIIATGIILVYRFRKEAIEAQNNLEEVERSAWQAELWNEISKVETEVHDEISKIRD